MSVRVMVNVMVRTMASVVMVRVIVMVRGVRLRARARVGDYA